MAETRGTIRVLPLQEQRMLGLLQANGAWLILGLAFLALILLARVNGARSGMGCCGGHQRGSYHSQRRADGPPDADEAVTEDAPDRRIGSSCH
jgi:hypothetical protein